MESLNMPINVYFISGLGADSRAFDRIHFEKEDIENKFNFYHIQWKIPNKFDSILGYAKLLSTQIKKNEKFILVGLSFGGLIAQEMNKFLSPEKTIIISSLKNSKDKSTLIKILKYIPFHKTFLLKSLLGSPLLLSSVLGLGKRNTEFKSKFLEMFNSMPLGFVNWGIHKIVEWEFKEELKNVIQIHGDKDKIFKIKNPNYTIIGGSHFMVYTKSKEIKEILKLKLLESLKLSKS